MIKLNCSENMEKEVVQQQINEDLALECYEVLSDDCVLCRLWFRGNKKL